MPEREQKQSLDNELEKPAKTLAEHFIQRWELFARQTGEGRYVCVHKQLKLRKVCSHLSGEVTLGAYLLNSQSQARFAVLDFDAPDGWKDLLELDRDLDRDQIPAYAEKSRRGGHLWFFFDQPVAGSEARIFARHIQDKYHKPECEIFPKQDKLKDGPGSLIRLPFGIHQLSGRRYSFFGSNGEALGPTIREQISAFDHLRFVPRSVFINYVEEAKKRRPAKRKTQPIQPPEPINLVSDMIKTHRTAIEFIGQYVELKPTTTGAIGLCPFHEDNHPSLGINEAGNYWHCFAGCGGGSIIDFWSKWREKQGQDASFVPTITELAEMLF